MIVFLTAITLMLLGVTRGELLAQEAPLEAGDAIRVTIVMEETRTEEYPVDESGVVMLPHVGPRTVTNIPAADLKRDLMDAYLRQFKEVQVTLLRRVRILGAVAKPGVYHIDPTMQLSDAIALAGGATREGKLEDITIVRNGAVVRSRVPSNHMLGSSIESGDEVIVQEKGWFARNGTVVIAAIVSSMGFLLSQAVN